VAGDAQRISGRTRVARALGVLAGRASRRLGLGRGGTVAGRVALAISPRAVTELTAGRFVVLVSGTNGKTTTAAYCAAALGTRGPVVTNSEGDNLLGGLAAATIGGAGDGAASIVLEVDEVVLPQAMAQTRPAVVVLLNLSRDQLDRTGEVSGHLARWGAALAKAQGTTVVANADDPLIASLVLRARPTHERVEWVAAGHSWRADSRLCPWCGHLLSLDEDFRCQACDFRRPVPMWGVTSAGLQHGIDEALPLDLSLPGRANRGNAAMAVAATAQAGIPPRESLAAIRGLTSVSGRYLTAAVGNHCVQFFLAKNPAGWSEALEMLAERGACVVVAINARAADGTDPSWLWDTPFERLRGRQVVVTGERRWDVAVRLEYAEVPHSVAPDVTTALAGLPAGDCAVLANYTAFRQAQAELLKPIHEAVRR
jgi:UDP-N-acetylmuramyl tripeptide synthase